MKRSLVPFLALVVSVAGLSLAQNAPKVLNLPTSKQLTLPAPGDPQQINSFPTAMAVSRDGKYLAVLNNGYGTVESKGQQSIAIVDLATNAVLDYPDARLGPRAAQTYFLGLAWSNDGEHLYASMASITDPLGEKSGHTGDGIAVYRFEQGSLKPERFIPIPLQLLAPGRKSNKLWNKLPDGKAIPYPAGIAVVRQFQIDSDSAHAKHVSDQIVVANNLSDNAILLDIDSGKILQTFDLSVSDTVPGSYPYSVVTHGAKAWVSLWNASRVAELDLRKGTVMRMVKLNQNGLRTGTHPTAMVMDTGAGHERLYVALSNADEVAVIDPESGRVERRLSTRLPGQKYGGTYPNALALSRDGKRLYVANASSNAVAVFDLTKRDKEPIGFIPTEWYPTALAASTVRSIKQSGLFIATGKGQGTGPNGMLLPKGEFGARATGHPYIASMLHGSLARLNADEIEKQLPEWTKLVERENLMNGRDERIEFKGGRNPIKHVIYIIKENRTYDQLFGDIAGANGDPSLVMYGEDITPNQHALARQFGVLDNFYDSGEISGNGHVWSTAAITSDYTEKTWQIDYRGRERTYDYEGEVSNGIPLDQGIPDVNEPGTGYLWANMARHKKTYRHYGEYVSSLWCNEFPHENQSPQAGTPLAQGQACAHTHIRKGEPLPANVGDPKGGPSPYPWPVPILARDIATKPELRGHFDPKFPDFRLEYPDQLRADEFLNEFAGYVKARQEKKGRQSELPEFIVLRLPNDHTSGTRPNVATPSAAVADNDLAVGRVAEAVSNSPYWDDTAIFVLEDDAQDGADHVDAHRSIALVISKYAPRPTAPGRPFVDHNFYTTVNVIHTMEYLVGVPPMNNNDAQAALMASMFGGQGDQPAFHADYHNRDNGLIYTMNKPNAEGAKESAKMDFSHADSVDSVLLNKILWKDRKGDIPMPKPVHHMCGEAERPQAQASKDEDDE